jgi:hypothetical protein
VLKDIDRRHPPDNDPSFTCYDGIGSHQRDYETHIDPGNDNRGTFDHGRTQYDSRDLYECYD